MKATETKKHEANNQVQAVTTSEKIGYGLGDFASNLIWTSMSMYLIFFYTDVVGIAASAIGTIMLISKLFDGLTDVGMGIIVDKTASKHGKAGPWLLWMAIPFALSSVLMFSVPKVNNADQIIFIIITYNLVSLLFTSINIPYGVLSALISQDQYERFVLNLYRMIFAMVGTLVVGVATLPLVNSFGGKQVGWQVTYSIYGALSVLFFFITFFTTKERVRAVERTSSEVPTRVGVRALLQNKYWAIVLVFFAIFYISQTALTGAAIYFA